LANLRSKNNSGIDLAKDTSLDETDRDLLVLGRIYRSSTGVSRYTTRSPNEFLCIDINDLAMHIVVLGQTGIGKTTFTIDLIRQLWRADPSISWTIIDLKGEYLEGLLRHIGDRITVYKPGLRQDHADFRGARQNPHEKVTFSPLVVNLFELGRSSKGEGDVESEERVERVFSILKESLAGLFRENAELSPMMERVLREALRVTYEKNSGLTRVGERFFDAVLSEIDIYAQAHGRERTDMSMSCEALKNRIDRFRRGILGRVFNNPIAGETERLESTHRTDNADNYSPSLINGKVVVDLSECIKVGCNSEDIRLLLNIIMHIIFVSAIRRGIARDHGMRHLTVVEEASLLVPDVLHRRTMGDLTAIEDMMLMARGFGEGLILVAQRPTISDFVLANAGTKIIFRCSCDLKNISDLLGFNEFQLTLYKSLKKFEAIAQTPESDIVRIVTPFS
jgi:DNA helicase HerA-like ATPase